MENKIYYNDPLKAKERQKVKPLSVEDIEYIVDSWSILMKHWNSNDESSYLDNEASKLFQSFIWDYENLCHLRSYTGGWIDVNKKLPKLTHKAYDYEYSEYVLVIDMLPLEPVYKIAKYKQHDAWSGFYDSNDNKIDTPHYWIPLPQNP